MRVRHRERHRTEHTGWLRAAVLGANDGILSTASLVLGVAAAHGTRSNVLVAGVAGLVAGAMSMAAGEYVSVHSQADTERAELELERTELKADDGGEHKELVAVQYRLVFQLLFQLLEGLGHCGAGLFPTLFGCCPDSWRCPAPVPETPPPPAAACGS